MANWKTSFLQEIDEICNRFKIKDYRAFVFWYIKDTENFSDNDIFELITDRGKDAGSDAVIIDHNIKTIKIIQSKFSREIGISPFNKDELNKLNKVYDYLTGTSDYYELRDYIHASLKEKLDKAIRLIKEDGYKVKLYFITTNKSNPNYSIYDNEHQKIEIISVRELERKYEEWRHGHTPELGDIEINYLEIMEGPKKPDSYLINISSEILRKEYLKFKDKLFSRNVRIFYSETKKPNKAIKKTLIEQPQNFWYFNNGITILSEKVNLQKEDKKIILKNPQIINGCQTVSTIGENRPSQSCLFAKIVEIGDSVINQELIDGIIEANNRQTPVDERMLKSNHPLQVRLQRNIDPLGYYYERKEGQYREEKAKSPRIGKLKCIKNIDLIKCNIALIKLPHNAHSHEDDLFSVNFNDIFKDEKTSMDYLIPDIIWVYIDGIGKNYRGDKRKRFHRLASFHILRIVYDFCSDLNNNLKLNELFKRLTGKSFEFNESPIKQLFDIAYKKYEKSKFVDVDSGQRDFFKHKDTYNLISEAVPSYLKNEIKTLFED